MKMHLKDCLVLSCLLAISPQVWIYYGSVGIMKMYVVENAPLHALV
jgi:hypothetical protein